MIARLVLTTIVTLLVLTGCKDSQEEVVHDEATSTVLEKEMMGGKYILEIASPNEHKYVEVSQEVWDRINPNDSVTLNDRDELIEINHVSLDE